MAKRKSGSDSGVNMQDLARAGAEARLEALRAEQAALLAAFPGLRGSSGQTRAPQAGASQGAAPARSSKRRGSGMSAAQRKAVGERMRAYWASRRAEKSGAAGAEPGGDETGTAKKRGRKRTRPK